MFKDNIIKTIKHYDNDEANTPVTLILKMGGWQNQGGVSEGSHWHTSHPVYSIAADDVKCNLFHTVPIVGWGTDMLVEAPVIVGKIPDSRADFRCIIEHRFVQDAPKEGRYDCHGQRFCSNSACHNLSHPPDMLYSHAEEYRKRGGQVCYTCHQDVFCSRCHPGGIITNP